MSQLGANSGQAQIRVMSWVLLFVPFFFTFLAYVLDMGRRVAGLPSWLGVAKVGLVVVAVYCLAAPFFMERVIARSAERLRGRGHDPDQSKALVCLGGSVGPSAFAMLLVMAGAPAALVYTWAPVSLVSAAYWGWRYRHVLVSMGERAA